MNQEHLAAFGAQIQRLIDREDLDRAETRAAFVDILCDRQPELHQGAFLAALAAKGETVGEIAGAWDAIDLHDTLHVEEQLPHLLVENSGTGMDRLKTFNVSSAAAIVAAAGGVTLARHGSRALSSRCGTVDILEAVGVDVHCTVAQTSEHIRSLGIGLFNGMNPLVHPGGLGRILSRIRFGSTLNIAASLANPARPTHAVRGVHAATQLSRVAEVMREIGYQHVLVVHGMADGCAGGMDELSVCGETRMLELRPDGMHETVLTPEAFCLQRHPFHAVASLDTLQSEASRFVSVLAGRGPKACHDFTCLNAAAVLFVAGRVDSIAAGVTSANELLRTGCALEKLRQWVSAGSTPDTATARLATALARAGVP